MIKLWVDDQRPAPHGWVRVSDYDSAILLIEEGCVEELSLDNDLGPLSSKDGRHILDWLEQQMMEFTLHNCPIVHAHTANPVEHQRMETIIARINEWQSKIMGK